MIVPSPQRLLLCALVLVQNLPNQVEASVGYDQWAERQNQLNRKDNTIIVHLNKEEGRRRRRQGDNGFVDELAEKVDTVVEQVLLVSPPISEGENNNDTEPAEEPKKRVSEEKQQITETIVVTIENGTIADSAASCAEIMKLDEVDGCDIDIQFNVARQNVDEEEILRVAKSWGQDRLDQANPVSNEWYNLGNIGLHGDGEGVTIYILDTGIRDTHSEFLAADGTSRARKGFSAGTYTDIDSHGHGSHCSGISVGKTVGVATAAKVVGVKVLGDTGGGSLGDIVAGINWVLEDCVGNCVISMSLTVGPIPDWYPQTALEKAISLARDMGIPSVVAAGNKNQDAHLYIPAREPTAITVGASDWLDKRAWFSNWGKIDMWAPGNNIVSADEDSDTQLVVMSGTSQATPYVAGVIAVYMSQKDFQLTVDEIMDAMNGVGISNIPSEGDMFLQGVFDSGKNYSAPEPSPSASPSVTASPTMSMLPPSASPSVTASATPSASVTASASPSMSTYPSTSASPSFSASPSLSASPTLSTSPSISMSPTASPVATPDDPCVLSPCLNGGVCDTTGVGLYKCRCVGGFVGVDCDTEFVPDECAVPSTAIICSEAVFDATSYSENRLIKSDGQAVNPYFGGDGGRLRFYIFGPLGSFLQVLQADGPNGTWSVAGRSARVSSVFSNSVLQLDMNDLPAGIYEAVLKAGSLSEPTPVRVLVVQYTNNAQWGSLIDSDELQSGICTTTCNNVEGSAESVQDAAYGEGYLQSIDGTWVLPAGVVGTIRANFAAPKFSRMQMMLKNADGGWDLFRKSKWTMNDGDTVEMKASEIPEGEYKFEVKMLNPGPYQLVYHQENFEVTPEGTYLSSEPITPIVANISSAEPTARFLLKVLEVDSDSVACVYSSPTLSETTLCYIMGDEVPVMEWNNVNGRDDLLQILVVGESQPGFIKHAMFDEEGLLSGPEVSSAGADNNNDGSTFDARPAGFLPATSLPDDA